VESFLALTVMLAVLKKGAWKVRGTYKGLAGLVGEKSDTQIWRKYKDSSFVAVCRDLVGLDWRTVESILRTRAVLGEERILFYGVNRAREVCGLMLMDRKWFTETVEPNLRALIKEQPSRRGIREWARRNWPEKFPRRSVHHLLVDVVLENKKLAEENVDLKEKLRLLAEIAGVAYKTDSEAALTG